MSKPLPGPLSGTVVVEMASIGPVPHCGLVLAEMGASVIRLDRVKASGLGIAVPARLDALARGKRSVALDLKTAEGLEAARALIERGQVVSTSIYEGAMALTAMIHGFRAAGRWQDGRGDNILDAAASFYRAYATADGAYMAVAAIEPKFYQALLAGLALGDAMPAAAQLDRACWPETARRFAACFAGQTQEAWTARFAGTDACVSPVLGWAAAATHPQAAALDLFAGEAGAALPRTAARFSATPCPPPSTAVEAGADTLAVLQEAGLPAVLIEAACARLTAQLRPA